MPSMLHEGLLLLFRNRPTLAPELLRDTLGVGLPKFSEARIESAQLTEVVPTEYRADLVVLLLDGKPVFAIVVEVQLSRDEEKRNTWPLYLASLRTRIGCPTALLVVTADESVASWAANPIELGHPGFVLRPIVMRPGAVPIITDADSARQAPELAVLSAMSHGHEQVGLDVAKAVLTALPGLEADRAQLYFDLVGSQLNEAAKIAFEALMQGNYQYQTDFAKRYYGQGHDEGREEGRQEGRQEGLCQHARDAVYEVLDARGLEPSSKQRARLDACEDLAKLKGWLRAAITATSLEDLFVAKSKKGLTQPRPAVKHRRKK